MTCRELRRKIHDSLDQRLPADQQLRLEEHLGKCQKCRRFYNEMDWIKRTLAVKYRLPEVSQRYLWKRLQKRIQRKFKSPFVETWRTLGSLVGDWDRQYLWSTLVAAPVTVGFFILILTQFSRVDFLEWNYPAVAMGAQVSANRALQPVLTQVSARFKKSEISDLVTAVGKIPFEDSLSVVVEITSDGHALISEVLEYPKSQDLLRAVDLSLRQSRFEAETDAVQPFVIYSFRKVDVYSREEGL